MESEESEKIWWCKQQTSYDLYFV